MSFFNSILKKFSPSPKKTGLPILCAEEEMNTANDTAGVVDATEQRASFQLRATMDYSKIDEDVTEDRKPSPTVKLFTGDTLDIEDTGGVKSTSTLDKNLLKYGKPTPTAELSIEDTLQFEGTDGDESVSKLEKVFISDLKPTPTVELSMENALHIENTGGTKSNETTSDVAIIVDKKTYKRAYKRKVPEGKVKTVPEKIKTPLQKSIEYAMILKLNDETCNKKPLSNEDYLKKAGCQLELLTTTVINQFKTQYHRATKFYLNSDPPHLQPYNRHWVRVEKVTPTMMGFLPTALSLLKNMSNYEFIARTNIKQVMLDIVPGRRGAITENNQTLNVNEVIKKLNGVSVEYFTSCGWPDRGIDLEKTIIHGLYTEGKTKIYQEPHTDYPYVTEVLVDKATKEQVQQKAQSGRKNKRKEKTKVEKVVSMSNNGNSYSWTAHMPVSEDGMWIHLWFAPGYGHSVKVNYGETLFLRSDVVHGGGVPLSVEIMGLNSYYRLHYYLVTDLQPAHPKVTNPKHYDNVTLLSDIYLLPEMGFGYE